MVAAKRILPAPTELHARWQAVFEEAGLRADILGLADRFPEERSLEIPFQTLDRIDTTLGDLLLDRPEDVLPAGVRGLRELLPLDRPELSGLRLR
ncbi:MAG: hypothetical protein HKL79_00890, partial [Thermoplasmata archaeon]|nr:hypothetical protein [Thermoplasmata archaeon]